MTRESKGSSAKKSGSRGRRTYDERAAQLVKAIDISESLFRSSKGLSKDQKKTVLDGFEDIRAKVTNPEPAFRNVKSLAYLEQAVVQPWNEMVGRDADEFWRRAAEAGLDYERRDVIADVLARKRIRDDQEYEVIMDNMDAMADEGKISADQAETLRRLVTAFENSH